jgi:hypothetical protein
MGGKGSFPFVLFFINKKYGKLPLALMNYRVLVICPHELSSAITDPFKLPNPSQQPPFASQLR